LAKKIVLLITAELRRTETMHHMEKKDIKVSFLISDVEAEAEAVTLKAVAFWWKRKRLKNLLLPLQLCFKADVQILVDYY
jgi:hypothetical protein